MLYLSLDYVLQQHKRIIEESNGMQGVRDMGALESALAQPRASFGGEDLYPTVGEKASALGFSLIKNHPFVDGNKRIGNDAMEIFLDLNGYTLEATIDEQEQVILAVAAGEMERDAFTSWVSAHLVKMA